jgi:hypothetical protein
MAGGYGIEKGIIFQIVLWYLRPARRQLDRSDKAQMRQSILNPVAGNAAAWRVTLESDASFRENRHVIPSLVPICPNNRN